MKRSFFLVALLVEVFAVSFTAYGQNCPGSPGCLDPTFGIGGMVISSPPLATTLSYQTGTKDMVFQSDGKIVVLTDATGPGFRAALARFTADGALDASFGTGGYAYIGWGTLYVSKLAIQVVSGEERFVVAGADCNGGVCTRVERYTSWGVLDTTFGTAGVTKLTNGWSPSSVAIQNDQKILLGGGTNPMIRLKANGTVDTTFGPNGISLTNPGMNVTNLYIMANGKVLAGGETWNGTNWDFAVGRFNSTGTLDATFGKKGHTSVDFAGKDDFVVGTITLDSAGKILVCGEAVNSDTLPFPKNLDAALVRLTSTGTLDTTFGSGGKAIPLNVGDLADYFASVSVQANGKIVLSGESKLPGNNANSDTLTARYNSNGTLDTMYNGTGWKLTEIYGANDPARKGIVQLDAACACEKFVVAGVANSEQSASSPRYNSLLRYIL